MPLNTYFFSIIELSLQNTIVPRKENIEIAYGALELAQ
jgi:hypothetical protein